MKVLKDVIQGSAIWHEIRKTRRPASEAPAVMSASKYMTRDQLMKQKVTGEVEEVSPSKQVIFNRGHDAEASARPIAERIVGEDLYPCTCEDDDGVYLASMDGLTLMEDVGFEHKLMNNTLRQATAETLDDQYKWQMDQQLLVTGAEKILFMASDGTEENCNWFWYERDESRIQRLIEGWDQFYADMANYEVTAPEQEVIPAAQAQLPALSVRLNGEIAVISNLDTFGQALTEYVDNLNLEPETDQEFADLEAACKNLKKAEDALGTAEENALAEISDVEQMRRTVSQYREVARQARLAGDKAVKAQKQVIKIKIAHEAKAQFDEHVKTLNKMLGGDWMPPIATDFNGALKNKRTVDSLRSAANDECSRARLEANRICSRIEDNLTFFDSETEGYEFLFADKKTLVIGHDREPLQAIVKNRIAEHKAKEEAKAEADRQRIREEERIRAENEAAEKARKEKADQDAAEQARIAEEQKASAAQKAADPEPAKPDTSKTTVKSQAGTSAEARASIASQAELQKQHDQAPVKAPPEANAGMRGSSGMQALSNAELHQGIIDRAPLMQNAMVRRPPDDGIINFLCEHYNEDAATVIGWLRTIDMDAAEKRLVRAA